MNHRQPMPTTHPGYSQSEASVDSNGPLDSGFVQAPPVVGLVRALCQALKAEGISYCHWKSNNALDRSASGDNDLDLLVDRADVPRFISILGRLAFKPAKASAEKRLPGVVDYFGYDRAADRVIHVHAHYQLVLGHDMAKNYRLPIERPYLESATQGELFKVPAVEFEFIVLVVRMMLKHCTWDVMLAGQGTLKRAEREELAYLQARISHHRVLGILKRHLPYIDAQLFAKCVRALQPDCPAWRRASVGRRLLASLRANARRPVPVAVYLKLWNRARLAFRRRILKSPPRYRLASGGCMIAIIGGDGAGKSTAIDGLYAWLSKNFATTRVHLGRPYWSWTTTIVRAILKIGNLLRLYPVDASFKETLNQKSPVSPGYPWLLREVCRARDRYNTYVSARRFAANGGLAVLDRFPVPQVTLMDGPRGARFLSQLAEGPLAHQFLGPSRSSRLAKRLVAREENYYRQTELPEVLVVLRLDPEIALQRRPDEDPDFVRERNTEIWEMNWEHMDAHVIDASQSRDEVLTAIKVLIWSKL
jgi:thymidylate kinase